MHVLLFKHGRPGDDGSSDEMEVGDNSAVSDDNDDELASNDDAEDDADEHEYDTSGDEDDGDEHESEASGDDDAGSAAVAEESASESEGEDIDDVLGDTKSSYQQRQERVSPPLSNTGCW